jgi:hypothetical protein
VSYWIACESRLRGVVVLSKSINPSRMNNIPVIYRKRGTSFPQKLRRVLTW